MGVGLGRALESSKPDLFWSVKSFGRVIMILCNTSGCTDMGVKVSHLGHTKGIKLSISHLDRGAVFFKELKSVGSMGLSLYFK